jgi:hypothetical protein
MRSATRNRNRRRVVAVSVASFLALLGYEAARLHNGDDPALARVKSSATKSQQSTTSSQQSTTGTDSGGYSDGGQSNDGGNYGGSQGYYTPPATASPSTGSS